MPVLGEEEMVERSYEKERQSDYQK